MHMMYRIDGLYWHESCRKGGTPCSSTLGSTFGSSSLGDKPVCVWGVRGPRESAKVPHPPPMIHLTARWRTALVQQPLGVAIAAATNACQPDRRAADSAAEQSNNSMRDWL